MPWSVPENIAPIWNEAQRYDPRRVIELGIGFGKYGTLMRELCDGIHGRCSPEKWQTTLVGVEIFEEYRNPAWAMYDQVIITDFASMEIAGYDLVLLIDSLEHLVPAEGRALVARLRTGNKRIIVSVPNGPCPQGSTHGNDHEAHLTTYHGPELEQMGATIIHRGFCLVASFPGIA